MTDPFAAAEQQVRDEALADLCREFATQFPTPNVQRGVRLAEAGLIEWQRLAALFERSLGRALDTLRELPAGD